MYRAVDCNSRRGKGCKSHAEVYEMVSVTKEARRVIMNNDTGVDIMNMAYKEGMADLHRVGLLKVIQGLTTPEEVTIHIND